MPNCILGEPWRQQGKSGAVEYSGGRRGRGGTAQEGGAAAGSGQRAGGRLRSGNLAQQGEDEVLHRQEATRLGANSGVQQQGNRQQLSRGHILRHLPPASIEGRDNLGLGLEGLQGVMGSWG